MSRVAVVAAIGAYFLLGSRLESDAAITANVLFCLGSVLTIAGALGRMWCAAVISGRKNTEVVNVGPYSLCRNPLYFFSFVGMIGVGLMTKTLTFPLVFIVFFAAYYPRVIRHEESSLFSRFGDKFTEFASCTPAFIPCFSHYRSTETMCVVTKPFCREVLHSGAFLLFIPGLHLAALLRGAGLLPTLGFIW